MTIVHQDTCACNKKIETPDPAPAEPAPDPKRDTARYVLTTWAEIEREAAIGAYPSGPFTPEWWCEPVEQLVQLMQNDGTGNSARVDAVQLLLRGADVEVVRMLRHLESINEAALVRALILCGFVVAIHEDTNEKTSRTIESLLDTLTVHTAKSPDEDAYDVADFDAATCAASLHFAGDVACVARCERIVGAGELLGGALWFPWWAALVGVTPGEQRWVVTAVYKTLTACADALDDGRNSLDPYETALARYLMLGELTEVNAAH